MNSTALPSQPAGNFPRVLAALHKRIIPPLGGKDVSYEDRVAWLSDEVCSQLLSAMTAEPDEPWLHIVCTTCLTPMLTGWSENCDALADQIEARCAVRPVALLQPYQCAGWGYALRFAGAHTDCRHLVISILDADMHDAVSACYESVIGPIGFGVTTVSIEIPLQPVLPQCGGPFPNRAFKEFLHALRDIHREQGRKPTFLPFMSEGFAGIAQRLIGTEMLAPNRHALYGHSFGADPWIGLIEWFQACPVQSEQTVTLGAFAYDGYFTLSNFVVSPSMQVSLMHGESGSRIAQNMAAIQ